MKGTMSLLGSLWSLLAEQRRVRPAPSRPWNTRARTRASWHHLSATRPDHLAVDPVAVLADQEGDEVCDVRRGGGTFQSQHDRIDGDAPSAQLAGEHGRDGVHGVDRWERQPHSGA